MSALESLFSEFMMNILMKMTRNVGILIHATMKKLTILKNRTFVPGIVVRGFLLPVIFTVITVDSNNIALTAS